MAIRKSIKGREIVKPANFSTDREDELQLTAHSQLRDSRFLFCYGKNARGDLALSWPQGLPGNIN